MVGVTSCQKREWNNPFDPECPKEIFTPSGLTALQEGTRIKLTWNQKNNQITGFIISRNENNGNWTEVAKIPKSPTTYIHLSPVGGVQYGYQIVAYAGTNNSNPVQTSITALSVPTVTTTAQADVTSTSAVLGGNVTNDGGSPVIERGVVYATSPNPSISNTKIPMGSGIGTFSETVSGLTADTQYFVKAYSINIIGIAYGNEISFTAGGPGGAPTHGEITDIEGNIYKTVTIGTQVWMAENLKVTRYNEVSFSEDITSTLQSFVNSGAGNLTLTQLRAGNVITASELVFLSNAIGIETNSQLTINQILLGSIPIISTDTTWTLLSTGAYCWYDNDIKNKDIYGALYNWYSVNSGKICPKGWHVPTDAEWTILTNFLGGEDVAGGKMKSVAGWISPNTGATNSSGFSALPGGGRYYYGGTFYSVGGTGNWWSNTEGSSSNAWHRNLFYYYAGVGLYLNNKANSFSVRCIKD
jgi:uncharacterized protein (TIGR02145 family)